MADKGGHTGSITVLEGHPLHVSPTTAQTFNTYRPALFPIACWHIYDIRFEFDSSFVLPDSQDEMAALAKLCDEHPGSPLSVFGHADPVGSEDYNKGLSGRRARAIYALTVRDVDAWEYLYTNSNQGGDLWGQKVFKTMCDALGREGVTNNKANRAEIIAAYMDFLCGPFKLTPDRFLGKGAGKDNKGDIQGCGEFNPLLLFSKSEDAEFQKPSKKNERNSENAPNRRVIVYLFRKDAVIDPGKWPCPTWKEGTAGCKKRFWSDSKQRLTLGAERRMFENTHDTFACRFYHRISSASPCESLNAPPSLMKIWNLKWTPDKGVCGDKVKLTGETNLVDATPIQLKLANKGGSAPELKPVDVTPTGGKFEFEFEIKDIAFNEGGKFCDKVGIAVESVTAPAGVVVEGGCPALTVEALLDTGKDAYDFERSPAKGNPWGDKIKYTNHAHFDQQIVKFRNMVHAEFKYMKAWGGYVVYTEKWLKGTVSDGPSDEGRRWGRSTTGNMWPEEYHDGDKWVTIPDAWLKHKAFDFHSVPFIQKGKKFVPMDGRDGEWPDAFADYNIDAPEYKQARKTMVDSTKRIWTDVLLVERDGCPSKPGTRCCRYDLEVNIEFNETKKNESGVIAMCPGNLRANAGCWYMGGDPDVAAHETGHHLDNPDEYDGGAIDLTLNIASEVSKGIEVAGHDTLMGSGKTLRKRHLRAIATMTGKLIKAKYGRDYKYVPVNKV